MLGAGASAAPLRALAGAGARQAQTFWTATGTDTVAVTYGVVLGALATVTMAIASAVVIATVVFSRVVRRERPDSRALPFWEIIAGIGCLAMPALGLALGSLIGVFVPRYVLLSAVGLAIVIATGLGRLTAAGSVPQYAAALAVVVAAGQAGAAAMTPGRFVQWNPCLERHVLADQLRTQPEIVVTGGVAYLQLWYYAPPELRSKMRYLADPAGALELTGTDSVDRGYTALARWTKLPVTDVEAYITQHRDFLVYDAGGFWSLPRLKAKGAGFQVIAREARGNLVRVRLARSIPAGD
jgi:hypothetical protein